jgi:hypothetical protein
MFRKPAICTAAILSGCLALCGTAWAGEDPVVPANSSASTSGAAKTTKSRDESIAAALAFLQGDAAKWREERGCATCHHGTMTVWALGEAKAQGYAVSGEALSDITQWTKNQFMPRFVLARDPRPGWSLVGVPAMYLGVMSQTLPVLSRDEIHQIAGHLARHQEEDGTWLLPPPANGAPPIWESPESLALWAVLAWEASVPANASDAETARAGRANALAWLKDAAAPATTQTAALRLVLQTRSGTPAEQLQPEITRLLARQNPDGGWSQTPEMPSDAFATGQTLWALSLAGAKPDAPEIERAVSFLVSSQQSDGSWAMTSRNHPGVETTRNPIRNPVPITYFGSAWATIGLVRTVPSPPDTPPRRQHAFDEIKRFHGTFDVDESSPDQPVVAVDLGNYEVEDSQVAEFARVLRAFPRLATLRFKSTKIGDGALADLKNLSGLRHLVLENTVITDTGLERLAAVQSLETLELKGSKVTDAGVEHFGTKAPRVRVVR